MSAPDIRAEIAGLFASLRRDIDEREQRALELLEGHVARPESAADELPDWKTLKEAAFACGCHVETMSRWSRVHGLGRRVDRTWRVDMRRVRAWQEGRQYDRLPQDEMPEDSASNDPRCRDVPDAAHNRSEAHSSSTKDGTS